MNWFLSSSVLSCCKEQLYSIWNSSVHADKVEFDVAWQTQVLTIYHTVTA